MRLFSLPTAALLCGLLLGCEQTPPPQETPAPLPTAAPTDLQIEGICEAPTGTPLITLNRDGSLLLAAGDSLGGRNWDRFGDSLVFYYQHAEGGLIREAHFHVDTLTAERLVLSPRGAPLGGVYRRR